MSREATISGGLLKTMTEVAAANGEDLGTALENASVLYILSTQAASEGMAIGAVKDRTVLDREFQGVGPKEKPKYPQGYYVVTIKGGAELPAHISYLGKITLVGIQEEISL